MTPVLSLSASMFLISSGSHVKEGGLRDLYQESCLQQRVKMWRESTECPSLSISTSTSHGIVFMEPSSWLASVWTSSTAVYKYCWLISCWEQSLQAMVSKVCTPIILQMRPLLMMFSVTVCDTGWWGENWSHGQNISESHKMHFSKLWSVWNYSTVNMFNNLEFLDF